MRSRILKSFWLSVRWLALIEAWSGLGATGPRILHLDQDYVEQSWTKEEGLPDDRVQAILQDHEGYLWIATHYGLARFDGIRFAVFNHANTPDMEHDSCLALAEDTKGTVWVATPSGLLSHSDGRIRMRVRWQGVGNDSLILLWPSHSTGIWVGTDQGLDFLQNGKSRHFDETTGLVSRKVTAVYEDASGTLWVGTDKGVQSLNVATGTSQAWPQEGSKSSPSIISIAGTGKENLWILCRDPKYEDRGNLFQIINGHWSVPWTNRIGNAGRRLFLSADRRGGWMACLRDDWGWVRYCDGKLRAFASFNAWPDVVPSCSLEDRDGNVWVGTESHGLHRLAPTHVQTLTTQEGLVHNNVRAVARGSGDRVWICSDQGLNQYQEGVLLSLTKTNGLADKSFRSVAEDRWGRAWIGSDGGGLNVVAGHQIFTVQLPGNNLDNKIRTVYSSKKGTLWIGTLRTLHRLDLRSDSFQSLESGVPVEAARLGKLTTFGGLGGFKETDVRALVEDSHGILWVGTAGQGVYRIDGEHVEHLEGKLRPTSDFVWAFCEDRAGTMWIGTDRGINRYQDGQFNAITVAQGLPDNLVNSLLEDDHGNLWVGHDHGIYRVSIQSLNEAAFGRSPQAECVSYDEGDGLLSVETNGQTSQPPAAKSHDGRLWFPTTKGVVILDPMNPPDLTNPPPVEIEHVRANGREVFGRDPNEPTARQEAAAELTSRRAKALLPAGTARILEFEYTAISFNAPQKVRFKYRLDGLDKDWIDAGSSRKAYYANLAPGDYRFRVIAANKHLVWNDVGASFVFHYAPFFYQTTLFYVVAVAGLMGLGFALYQWRMGEARRQHRLQAGAALLRERERIGKDLHDGLGANLTRLSLLVEQAGRESSGAEGKVLRKVSESARGAVQELREIIWASDPGDETFEGVLPRICQTAEELLGPAGIRCRFDLPPELPRSKLTPEERHNLLFVAKEAANNAAKHARASEVRIQVSAADHGLSLVIADDGCGFSSAEIGSNGHGLANMRQRIEQIGGRFELESETDRGTTIRIHLQLKEE